MVIRRRYIVSGVLLVFLLALGLTLAINQQMSRPHELGLPGTLTAGPDGRLEIQPSGCFLRGQEWPVLRFKAISLSPKLVLRLKEDAPEHVTISMENLHPDASLEGADVITSSAGGKTVSLDLDLQPGASRTLEWKPPVDSGSFTFFAFGDNHEQYETLEKIREDVMRERPLFVVHAGDLTNHGTEEELLKHEAFAETVPVPYFTCLGNHDLEDDSHLARPFQRIFGPTFHEFAYGNAVFIFLDNAAGYISPQQLWWLNGRLRSHRPDNTIFVFAHQPLIDPRRGHHHAMKPLIGGAGLLAALSSRAGVDFFIFGHLHSYYEFERGGAMHIITGNAKPGGTESPLPFPHYTKFVVTPQGVGHVPRFLIDENPKVPQ
jgi:Icc protein